MIGEDQWNDIANTGKYPKAFEIYENHCLGIRRGLRTDFTPRLEGTCLLIPPQESDYDYITMVSSPSRPESRSRGKSKGNGWTNRRKISNKTKVRRHWIACLFTSIGYGAYRDGEDDILRNTERAMEDLVTQVLEMRGREKTQEERAEGDENDDHEGDEPGALWACKINSGKFGVEWEKTARVLRRVLNSGGKGLSVKVVER
jgi:ADP-ribose 1''-phosphate phosphatase